MADLIFKQLLDYESNTLSYLLADPVSKEGLIIDSVLEMAERDIQLIKELGLKLKYILETHVHADHITGASLLKKAFPEAQIALSKNAGTKCADIKLEDTGSALELGAKLRLEAMATPGHTNGCMSYYLETPGDQSPMVFTGDCLLIRKNGRTDFQEGSNEKLFHSVREKLFKLPDKTIVYPGHEYNGLSSSSIAEEKKHNLRLGLDKSFEEFCEIMDNLNLAPPKKIKESVPANLCCGNLELLHSPS